MKTLILSLLLFLSIESYSNYNIVVYGSNNCGYTSALKADLIKNNITFTYCDINDAICYNAFFSFVIVHKLDTNNYVNLPVVRIDVNNATYGLVRPQLATIKQLIGITSAKTLYASTEGLIGIIGARNIEVYDMRGIRVLYSNKNYIDTQYLPSGYYIFKINKNTFAKFVKY